MRTPLDGRRPHSRVRVTAVFSTFFVCVAMVFAMPGSGGVTALPRVSAAAAQTPTDPAARVFSVVCGRCHAVERITAVRRTRGQWQEVITTMITSRNAQVSDEEFDIILGYLSREFGTTPEAQGAAGQPPPTGQPPSAAERQAGPPAAGGRQGAPAAGRGGGGLLAGAGPSDKPPVDPAAADRGRRTWASECIDCHGTQARGTDKGPNLVRSLIVLRDRYGSQLGPFLKQGHRLQSGASGSALSDAQIEDLAHFVRQRVNDGLRGSPLYQPQNVLTGNAKAGQAFFNGEGKCTTCHAPGGNLAGIGAKLEPIDIQQRFLFPGVGRGGRGRGAAAGPNPNGPRVSVTPAGGKTVSGALVQIDDFYVSLRTAEGTPHTFRITPGTKVERQDPLAFHVDLLDRLTDTQMHDVVAYLETLK